MLEGFLHCALGDFVESDAADAVAVVAILIFFFVFFLPILLAVAQFFGQVSGDGFAFAVRVRREIDVVGRQRQLLQLGENFFFAGNDDVLGIEFIFDIHTQLALGQIFDVTERGFDGDTLCPDISG